MTNPPLIKLRIAPYVKAGHPKVGAVFKIVKVGAVIKYGGCRFTRLFFCIPAPEVLSAASLRSAFRRFGEVISRSDGYLVVKDQRAFYLPLIYIQISNCFGSRFSEDLELCPHLYTVLEVF